jgi:uncharacterized protein (TIGR03083 family)
MATLHKVEPHALTSCPGWTAHHLAAHICGNYEEIEQHVAAFGERRPLERTRTWEEREQPLRELDHAVLLRRIEDRAAAAAAVIGDVLNEQPEAELTWTGRTVRVSGFPTHLRSENALHRWDIVGDDETSHVLLAQQDLLVHAVSFIGRPLLRRGLDAGAATEPFCTRVRSEGRDDLVIDASGDDARLSVRPSQGSPTIEGDPAARLLLVWGRKPAPSTVCARLATDKLSPTPRRFFRATDPVRPRGPAQTPGRIALRRGPPNGIRTTSGDDGTRTHDPLRAKQVL